MKLNANHPPNSRAGRLFSSRLNSSSFGLKPSSSLPIKFSTKLSPSASTNSPAFTIVELLIVVVVIAILAAITIVSYNGITESAKETTLKSDLTSAAKQLQLEKVRTGSYPSQETANLKPSSGTEFAYTPGTGTFCLQASNPSLPDKAFHITEAGAIEEGDCPEATLYIQTITNANCPTERTVAVDARDNHTYFIQQLADGKCWMLTNLAYAGGTSNGGTNTYNDTIPTGDGTNGTLNGPDNSGSATYTLAKYYTHTNASPSIHPATPSTSTDGGVTNSQYGYLYNWCAAMGAQSTTSACAHATTPAPDQNISICPAGWRLPTSGSGAEFEQLTIAIGATNNAAGSTVLRSTWLAQLGGSWYDGFNDQGSRGNYWSASQGSVTYAHYSGFSSSYVYPSLNNLKSHGLSVRCIAS